MANERLRQALISANLTVREVAEQIQVDPKTVERWVNEDGRVPHAVHRAALARLLGADTLFLWPGALASPSAKKVRAEVVAAYAHRADLPAERWWQLIDAATAHIDLLGYAMLFLPESHPRLVPALRAKAAHGAVVRIALADPDSQAARDRDAEEQLDGGLLARIRTAARYFGPALDLPAVAIRLHHTPLYNSVFRFDDDMLVTPHLYGEPGYTAPLLHLHRLAPGGLFDAFARHFDAVWNTTTPWEPPNAAP